MLETIESRFKQIIPSVDFCSLRFVSETDELLSVRQDVPEPPYSSRDVGAMITVIDGGGLGYAATCDLTLTGLQRAADQATDWARLTADRSIADFSKMNMPHPTGEYIGPEEQPYADVSLADKYAMIAAQCAKLKTDDSIVDYSASLWRTGTEVLYLTSDGGRVYQKFAFMAPDLTATANEGPLTQTRSLGGRGRCLQGGMEVLDAVGFATEAPRIAAQAVELLKADNCPTDTMDLLLGPEQMILQIHESIGHPLELDRILGDERNYAGTSFVTMDMVGSYKYGSDLLNITYDPSRGEQFASFGYDDEGSTAERQFIIENGMLKRVLGGFTSQQRTGMDGVANARACSWNRPPIDRMANLNLEPGQSSFDEMVASVERGVYMDTNCSWSIDDSRNKFQFGCEWSQLIEDGKLTKVVRSGNYRGISATFWRNLKMVGNESTLAVLGTPNCGKGEPNQQIRVAHASPTCLFTGVDVFGGE